jgi:putative multiple sugar transport system permease protein
VIGALLMAVMNNGMSILGIGIDYQQIGHRADACRVH